MRYYKTKSGNKYPSVTSILPDFPWGNEEAKERGTAVHHACKLYNEGRLNEDTLDPRLINYFEAYKLLVKETGLVVTRSELMVISDKYRVAGTLDIEGQLGRYPIIADLKTGNYSNIQSSWELQLSAYDVLHKETTGDKRKRKLYVFALWNDGTYRIFEMKEKDAFPVFLSYLRVFKWEERWK